VKKTTLENAWDPDDGKVANRLVSGGMY